MPKLTGLAGPRSMSPHSFTLIALALFLSVVLLSCAPKVPTATPVPAPAPATAAPTPAVPATALPSPAPTVAPAPSTPAPTPPPAPPAAATPLATAAPPAAAPTAAPTPPVLLVPPPGAVRPDAVDSTTVSFQSEGFNVKAYLARPKETGTFPAMLIIHENRGLTPHQEDVARRFANQGYVALAVDFLSRVGGASQFAATEAAVAAIGALNRGVMKDAEAGVKYLQTLPYVKKARIGVIGYCWGGGNSLLFATRNQDIKAAVVYYGPNPANLDEVANVSAPMLGIYASEDPRITVNVPRLEETMKKYGKSFEHKVYQGAFHAFFNDTGARYHPEAAADA